MKKKAKPTGFWITLESLPSLSAVAFEWRKRTGNEYDSIQSLLKPDGRLASSHPCIRPSDCGCYHDVVIHSPDDIVAVCRCGRECDTIQLTSTQLAVYTLDRLKLDTAIAKAFKLNSSNIVVSDIPRTTCVGQLTHNDSSLPVFLTIQSGSMQYTATVEKLLARCSTPIVLLTPLPDLVSAECTMLLSSRGCYTIALSDCMVYNEKFILSLTNVGSEFFDRLRVRSATSLPTNSPDTSVTVKASGNLFVLERREVDGEVHWMVNGLDRGRFSIRKNSKKASILSILYDEIGNSWVSHDRFMKVCGWNSDAYFSSNEGDTGSMQKQLNIIRRFLGLRIEFHKDKGVRFFENVQKLRK